MDWNLKINGESVKWELSDFVAIVPDSLPPRPKPRNTNGQNQNGKYQNGRYQNATYQTGKHSNGKHSNGKEPNGKEPGDTNSHNRERRDLETFKQAGWDFRTLEELPPPPDNGRSRGKQRQVFTNHRGDVLIETDVATVQLNAAATTKQYTVEKVLAEDGLTIIRQLSFAPHLYTVRLPKGRLLPEMIAALQAKTDRYVFAEPSMLQRMSGRQAPNDPQLGAQWQHEGQYGLHSLAAWEITKGAGVRIAIIDNGMDINHEDLKDGIKGGGVFEQDGAGAGTARFFRFDPDMPDFPDVPHGTACMAMAGARANNGIEGCGIAPECDLLAIACALDQTGNQETLARAIEYAINPQDVDPDDLTTRGADIISCSLDTAYHVESVLRLAIDSAAADGRDGKGVPVFWAVNNVDESLSEDLLCSLENVIAVGRSGQRGGVAAQCAFGPKLEFLAPGINVVGPIWNDSDQWSGASFATPLAAGVAALVLERHRDWFAADVLQRLRDTCDMPPHRPSQNQRYGHGRINAYRAVHDPE